MPAVTEQAVAGVQIRVGAGKGENRKVGVRNLVRGQRDAIDEHHLVAAADRPVVVEPAHTGKPSLAEKGHVILAVTRRTGDPGVVYRCRLLPGVIGEEARLDEAVDAHTIGGAKRRKQLVV